MNSQPPSRIVFALPCTQARICWSDALSERMPHRRDRHDADDPEDDGERAGEQRPAVQTIGHVEPFHSS